MGPITTSTKFHLQDESLLTLQEYILQLLCKRHVIAMHRNVVLVKFKSQQVTRDSKLICSTVFNYRNYRMLNHQLNFTYRNSQV